MPEEEKDNPFGLKTEEEKQKEKEAMAQQKKPGLFSRLADFFTGRTGDTPEEPTEDDPEASSLLSDSPEAPEGPAEDFNKRLKKAKENRGSVINKMADELMDKVRAQIGTPENQQFLDQLDGVLRQDSARANQVRNLIASLTPEDLMGLTEDFKKNIGNEGYSLANRLVSVVRMIGDKVVDKDGKPIKSKDDPEPEREEPQPQAYNPLSL